MKTFPLEMFLQISTYLGNYILKKDGDCLQAKKSAITMEQTEMLFFAGWGEKDWGGHFSHVK